MKARHRKRSFSADLWLEHKPHSHLSTGMSSISLMRNSMLKFSCFFYRSSSSAADEEKEDGEFSEDQGFEGRRLFQVCSRSSGARFHGRSRNASIQGERTCKEVSD